MSTTFRAPAPDEQALLASLQVRLLEPAELARCSQLLDQYHYLKSPKPVGERLYYVVTDRQGQWKALLVFAAAYIGVAMGARGSDAALEQADVILMHDRLENFLAAFRLSQRARRVIRQNLIISMGTVVVLVTFAIMGQIPLTVGVVGHEGSTVIVVMNSLRLLFGAARPAR